MTIETNDTERWEGDSPDRTGWTATGAGVLGALAMTSCCILPLVLVSLGVTGSSSANLQRSTPTSG